MEQEVCSNAERERVDLMAGFESRHARGMMYDLVWGSCSDSMIQKVNEWLSDHRNDKIIDIQCTEVGSQYTVHFFYEEG